MKVSAPRFERQSGGRRVRVRDVPEQMFRVKMDRRYIAQSVPDEVGRDSRMNFSYALLGVDAGIADVLRILNRHGYVTMTSQSGLLVDYPTSKEGAEFGYILFFRMEPALEKRIAAAARKCGMGIELRRKGSWARGLRLDTAVLKNGQTKEHVYDAACADARRALGPRSGFRPSSGFRKFAQRRVEERTTEGGGFIGDAAVRKLWRCFTQRLTGERAKVF
jgi:hypothetical protein